MGDDNKDIEVIWNKFESFANDDGYNRPLPDRGFMDKHGNAMILINEKEVMKVDKNEIMDVDFSEVEE